jgi:hypothetical protein
MAAAAEAQDADLVVLNAKVYTVDARMPKAGLGDEWIKLGATCKHSADGSFSERTMALSIPYPGVSGTHPPEWGMPPPALRCEQNGLWVDFEFGPPRIFLPGKRESELGET